MDQNRVAGHSYRRSPSHDRFIGVFSRTSDTDTSLSFSGATTEEEELNENEVFFNSDFSEPQLHHIRHLEKLGILAALPEGNRNLDGQVIHRKPAICSSSTKTSSRAIPSIPKPHMSSEVKYSQSMPLRRFHQSAPVNVPMIPRKPRREEVFDQVSGREADDDEMMPPHEIVTCASSKYQNNTFSVLEGVGRTLKGRDLRQVRNAVWRQTGFVD